MSNNGLIMEFATYFKERKNYWLLPTILLLSLVLLSSGVLAFSMSSLNDDIEVYYSFDNDVGNLINNSVDLNDGYSANPSYVSGISGNAFNFVTGIDDTVNFTDPLISDQSFTVSFWLYLNGTAEVGYPSVLGDGFNGNWGGFNMLFNAYTASYLCPLVSNDSMSGIKQGRYCIIDIPNNFTGWKHIVLVFDEGKGGLNEVYVNGNLSLLQIIDMYGNTAGYEYNYTTDFQTTGYDFVLGTEVSDPTREFNGYIDEVGIWSKALNQTEVTALYSGDLYSNVSASLSYNWTSDLNNDLEVYYTFDTSNATETPDSLGIYNMSLYYDVASVTGKFGNALSFARLNSSYAQSNYYLASGDNPFSFSFWVYPIGSEATNTLLFFGDRDYSLGSFDVFYNWYGVDDNVFVLWDSDNATASGVYPKSNWYHVVGVADGSGNRYLYVDGVLVNSTSALYNVVSTYPLTLGFLPPSYNNHFTGLIDEVGVWNRTLNQTEVTQLYNSGNGIQYSPSPASPDLVYPDFSDYYDNSGELIDSGTAIFNVTVYNTNYTVVLVLNGSSYIPSNDYGDVYSASVSLINAGTYDYYWYAYGSGTNNNYNSSANFTYVVNQSVVIPNPTPTNNYDVIGASGYGISVFFGSLTSSLSGLLLIIAIVGAIVLVLGGVVFLVMYAINYAKTR